MKTLIKEALKLATEPNITSKKWQIQIGETYYFRSREIWAVICIFCFITFSIGWIIGSSI